MKKTISKVLSTPELKLFWNDYSHSYISKLQECTTEIFHKLLPFCELKSSKTILEVGCGSGNGLEVLRPLIPKSVPIHACDISEKMLQFAKEKKIENVDIVWGDSENLPYTDNFCDRYMANLCLPVVADPQKMLNEAFRVVELNGIAVVSVIGKPSPSNLHSIVGRACNEIGFPSSSRSIFHLQDKDLLRSMIQKAGFSNVLSFYSSAGFGIVNIDEALYTVNDLPVLKEIKDKDEIAYKEAMKIIESQVKKVLDSGSLLTFDCLIARASKHL